MAKEFQAMTWGASVLLAYADFEACNFPTHLDRLIDNIGFPVQMKPYLSPSPKNYTLTGDSMSVNSTLSTVLHRKGKMSFCGSQSPLSCLHLQNICCSIPSVGFVQHCHPGKIVVVTSEFFNRPVFL